MSNAASSRKLDGHASSTQHSLGFNYLAVFLGRHIRLVSLARAGNTQLLSRKGIRVLHTDPETKSHT